MNTEKVKKTEKSHEENWLTQLPEMEGMVPIDISAKVKNESGLVLYVPKEDEYPLLFLEWLEQKQSKSGFHAISVDSKQNRDYLRIRMTAGILETYTDACDFINETKDKRFKEEYAIVRGALRGEYPARGQGLNNKEK